MSSPLVPAVEQFVAQQTIVVALDTTWATVQDKYVARLVPAVEQQNEDNTVDSTLDTTWATVGECKCVVPCASSRLIDNEHNQWNAQHLLLQNG